VFLNIFPSFMTIMKFLSGLATRSMRVNGITVDHQQIGKRGSVHSAGKASRHIDVASPTGADVQIGRRRLNFICPHGYAGQVARVRPSSLKSAIRHVLPY